ncbi:MAG: ABC transporter permease subunit [Chloroflexota bacterium]|nr:ABC transporter permease subunit [Chloroflexota bacterium]
MTVLTRLARVPLTVLVLGLVFAAIAPAAMASYQPFQLAPGIGPSIRVTGTGPGTTFTPFVPTIETQYQLPLGDVIAQATIRSSALLAGVAVFSLVLGVLLGVTAALVRRRALASGAVLGTTSVVAAIPSFFLAYFLQILIIFIGGAAGHSVLPVFGYGLDGHLVLPLLALSAPAVATTAQLTAVRMGEVFDADFITTANAKGLLPSWIIKVHVLPHVLPVSLEAVGSGLRVAVASLPIVEYILLWNGIGFVALQSIALRDPAAFTACMLVLATLFTLTSLLLDVRRTRFH